MRCANFFEIQLDDLISTGRPDQQKNDNLPNSGFWCPGRPQSKTKEVKKEINVYTLLDN